MNRSAYAPIIFGIVPSICWFCTDFLWVMICGVYMTKISLNPIFIQAGIQYNNLKGRVKRNGFVYTAFQHEFLKKIRQHINKLYAILATITAGYCFAFFMRDESEGVPQAKIIDTTTEEEKRRHLATNDFLLNNTRFKGELPIVQVDGINFSICKEDLITLCKRNSVRLVAQSSPDGFFGDTTTAQKYNGFKIGFNKCIINMHCYEAAVLMRGSFYSDDPSHAYFDVIDENQTLYMDRTVDFSDPSCGVSYEIRQLISEGKSIPTKVQIRRDAVIINLSGPAGKSLRKFFTPYTFASRFQGKGCLIRYDKDLKEYVTNEVEIKSAGTIRLTHPTISDKRVLSYNLQTEVGDCGAVLLGYIGNERACILGIHCAGDSARTGVGYAVPIGIEDIPVESQFELIKVNFPETSDPHPKSPLNWTPDTVPLYSISSIKETSFRMTPQTSLVPTRLANRFPDVFFDHAPAMLRDDKNGIGPFGTLISNLENRPKPRPDATCFNKAFKDLFNSFAPLKELDRVIPSSEAVAIRGNQKGYGPINRKSSMGWPYQGPKKNFIHIDEDSMDFELHTDLKFECTTMHHVCKEGVPLNVVNFVPKDEIRSKKKVESGNTRLFTVFPAAFTILCRIFVLPLMDVIFGKFRGYGCCVGINAGSIEWNELYFNVFSPFEGCEHLPIYALCLDYAFFDKSFRTLLLDRITRWIYVIATCTAYTYQDQQIALRLLYAMYHVVLNYRNDLMYACDFNQSGSPETVHINSLVNEFILRYCYYRAVKDAEDCSFRKFVKLGDYGDDLIGNVHPNIIEDFNQFSIQKHVAELGFGVTPAIKDAEMTQFCDMRDVTFLKRSFVFDEEFGGYRAPLDQKSIIKCLCWRDCKSPLTEEMYLSAAGNNAAREWFLHGRHTFEVKVKELKEIFELEHIQLEVKTFDEYLNDYREKNFSTWDL